MILGRNDGLFGRSNGLCFAGKEELRPYSAGDVYESSEFFRYFVSRADLENPKLDTVPVEISWNRVSQFLPWMQMGDAPGKLLFSGQGWKLRNGYLDLPQNVRSFVEAKGQLDYMHAPDASTIGKENATSWRYFAEQLELGNYKPNCE